MLKILSPSLCAVGERQSEYFMMGMQCERDQPLMQEGWLLVKLWRVHSTSSRSVEYVAQAHAGLDCPSTAQVLSMRCVPQPCDCEGFIISESGEGHLNPMVFLVVVSVD